MSFCHPISPSVNGSSPRAWGRLSGGMCFVTVRRGSSPRAWGRSIFPAGISQRQPVHPHVRGADEIGASTPLILITVHPHVRGADRRMSPACAAKCTVHSHVRGVDLSHRRRRHLAIRFIPTCVGQMPQRRNSTRPSPVHLHVRGADRWTSFWQRWEGGSSPRAWGRCRRLSNGQQLCPVHPHVRGADLPTMICICWLARFIPTCVGQILSAHYEHDILSGSSPRAWGRWLRPDCARLRRSVHPHVRGADVVAVRLIDYRPRFIPTCVGQMRFGGFLGGEVGRFIPTCVGQIH